MKYLKKEKNNASVLVKDVVFSFRRLKTVCLYPFDSKPIGFYLSALFFCTAFFGVFYFSVLAQTAAQTSAQTAEQTAAQSTKTPLKRVYSTLYEPSEHPDFSRYAVTPPTWKTFDGQTQFICLRSFSQKDNVGQDFEKTIDKFVNAGLGRVLWPAWNTIYFKNLDELADIVKKRNLYLFDFWGYVPGSGAYKTGNDFWLQFRADPKQFQLLEDKLGDHWLGMDNGEQDGRYIGGYSPSMYPVSEDDFEQYLHFQRHFEQLGDDLGNRLATLVSLNFGHYFLKEGIYTLIGAETAQALPNSQVYYSYIRGAGKQYGVLWFGNSSVYNRWGWKSYPNESADGKTGPTKGSSLSLLKRLTYCQILYNSAAVGFENCWFIGDELSPMGKIQQAAARWVQENGTPGVMSTQVALLTDFQSGWSFPRHLYTNKIYRVWGNIPYRPGDYLNNDVLGMIYPDYQESSYFHDETGFLTATPYSDTADCLLSDTPLWLLERYPTVIVSGNLSPNLEIFDKLEQYVANGGRLVLTAENLAQYNKKYSVDFLGLKLDGSAPISMGKNAAVLLQSSENNAVEFKEKQNFNLYRLVSNENLRPLGFAEASAESENPGEKSAVAYEYSYKNGSVLLLTSPFGLAEESAATETIKSEVDQRLANPYPLLEHAQYFLDKELKKTVLFNVGEGLGSIICRKDPCLYTVGIFNNQLKELPFEIQSNIGEIESIRELAVDTSERGAVGLMPFGFENTELGTHTEKTIAGADVRIFEVRLKAEQVEEIAHQVPTKRVSGRFLPLRSNRPLKEELLLRPTFFEHYDGVMLDWKYLDSRSAEEIEREAGWIKRQKVRVAVDFSSGINLFPDLRLIKNDVDEYEKSMKRFKDVLSKLAVLGGRDAVLVPHRTPENNYSGEQTRKDTILAFQEICVFAKEKGIRISLRISANQSLKSLQEGAQYINDVGSDNLFLIYPLALSMNSDKTTENNLNEKIASIRSFEKYLSFLTVTAPKKDVNGEVWSIHAPISEGTPDEMETALRISEEFPSLPLLFDAVYESNDAEYRDIRLWE